MSKQKICPCCGQLVAPKIVLPPIKQRIYDAVATRPRTADELRDAAGSYYPDRGFLTWKCIYGHIYQLNRILKSYGLAVRQPARFGLYHLEVL